MEVADNLDQAFASCFSFSHAIFPQTALDASEMVRQSLFQSNERFDKFTDKALQLGL